MAPQFTGRKMDPLRVEPPWMAWLKISLPVPVSPVKQDRYIIPGDLLGLAAGPLDGLTLAQDVIKR